MLADRFPRKKLIIIFDLIIAVLMCVIGYFALNDILTLPLLIPFALAFGIFEIAHWTTWSAFLGDVVKKNEVTKVSALFESAEAISVLIGPIGGAFIYSFFGLTGVILVDVISCLFGIATITLFKSKKVYLLWFGQTISWTGSAMSFFAIGVWIYETTGKASALSTILFIVAIVGVVTGPFGGVLADRFPRKTLIIIFDLTIAVLMCVIGYFALNDILTLPLLIPFALAFGIFEIAHWTTWSAFLGDVVKKNEVTKVSALFESCLLYTSPSPRDRLLSRMPSSA